MIIRSPLSNKNPINAISIYCRLTVSCRTPTTSLPWRPRPLNHPLPTVRGAPPRHGTAQEMVMLSNRYTGEAVNSFPQRRALTPRSLRSLYIIDGYMVPPRTLDKIELTFRKNSNESGRSDIDL